MFVPCYVKNICWCHCFHDKTCARSQISCVDHSDCNSNLSKELLHFSPRLAQPSECSNTPSHPPSPLPSGGKENTHVRLCRRLNSNVILCTQLKTCTYYGILTDPFIVAGRDSFSGRQSASLPQSMDLIHSSGTKDAEYTVDRQSSSES